MMNPQGGQTNSMPGMDMPGDIKSNDNKSNPVKEIPAESKPSKDNSMPGMDMPANPKPVKKNTSASCASSPLMQPATFGVSGNCEMCKDRIEEAATSVKGVSAASWDVKTKKINVKYDATLSSISDIQKAIAKAGHDTGKFKADDRVYKSLPECCLYRK